MDMKEWIRAARLHAKLTQQQLGDSMSMSKGNVWAWEKGNHEASLAQLIKIAEITGFREPLPGTPARPETKSDEIGAQWPFASVSQTKVQALSESDKSRLDAALIASAVHLGLDIKKTP